MMTKLMQRGAQAATVIMLAVALAACGTVRQSGAPALSGSDQIVLATMANFTETPDAGHSAESITANALRASGIDVRLAPVATGNGSASALFTASARADVERTMTWARTQKARYVLSGAVEEWRYKTGVDGEPVVGVTYELTDVDSGKVVWSATGTKSGFSRSSLSTVATRLIFKTLAPLARQR
ncbi:penicillin-binding protein activator LpoB [Robbsia andropogonis]|nr:penicillin-binding protein activator LpoB [Robbsia andropogonis]